MNENRGQGSGIRSQATETTDPCPLTPDPWHGEAPMKRLMIILSTIALLCAAAALAGCTAGQAPAQGGEAGALAHRRRPRRRM